MMRQGTGGATLGREGGEVTAVMRFCFSRRTGAWMELR